jgi:hypothetical protein
VGEDWGCGGEEDRWVGEGEGEDRAAVCAELDLSGLYLHSLRWRFCNSKELIRFFVHLALKCYCAFEGHLQLCRDLIVIISICWLA